MINTNQNDSEKGEFVNTDQTRLEWLEARRSGIGGSDVSAVLGINPWKTPFQLWEDKTGKFPVEEKQNEAMYWGNVLEDIVSREFARRTGHKVERRNKMYRMEKYPFMIANIDRYIVGQKAILEVKTANAFMAKIWGDPGSDMVPMQYLAQCQHYMMVTEYFESYLAVLIGGNDYRNYNIEHNQELADLILEKCNTFWNDHVLKDIPPDPISLDDIQSIYSMKSDDACITANDGIIKAFQEYQQIKDQMKALKDSQDKVKFMIQDYMKENAILVNPEGETLATWKENKTSRFDTKKFKEKHPDLYSEFVNENVTRRFLDK
jgi:putative phage-type endonuclease